MRLTILGRLSMTNNTTLIPVPENEKERLEALLKYNILDTISDEEFDNITNLASYICQTPIAMISFIDKNRQWHKSKLGIEEKQSPRESSFCQYTIMENGILEIPNTLENDLFCEHPAVTGDSEIRFYAGTPLTTPEGLNIGVLCVIDTIPKQLDENQKKALSTLAQQVITLLELKNKNFNLGKEVDLLAQKALENISLELETYKSALDDSSIVAITDSNGLITYVNDKFCAISKYSKEELIGQSNSLLNSGYHDREFFLNLWKTISEGSIWKSKIKNKAKDGTFYWQEHSIIPFIGSQGKPTKFVSISKDITKEKQEEEKIDQFFNLSSDYLCIADTSGFFEKVSPTFSNTLGYSIEELLSKSIYEFIHEDDIANTVKEFEKLANKERTISFENRYRGIDGSYITLSWNASLNQESGLIYGTARDITRSKRLYEENKRLALVAKNTNNLIIIADKNCNIQWVNEPFENITGYSLQEVAGEKFYKTLNQVENDSEKTLDIKQAIKNQIPYSGEISSKNKAGKQFWLQINITPVFNEENELINFIVIESDITEKKQRNQRIQNLIKTQQSIFDGASYSIIFSDSEGVIQRVNKACLSLLEYSEEELLGKSPLLFHDKTEMALRVKQLEEEFGRPVKLGHETFALKAKEKNIADANEWTYITKSGKRIPVWLNVTCIKDKHGEVLGYLGVAEDYTFKKKVESELISAKKIAEQAVTMKDNFLANMSHEIRTPMNAIIGFTDLLSTSNLDKVQKEFVNNVKVAGENLLLIINDILDLSKIESGKLVIDSQPFNIKHTLKHVYDLLNIKAKEKNLDFNLYLDADMPDTVIGDKGRINQIIMNLAGNAIKFTKEGEVNILVKKLEETDGDITLKFSIKDTGIGISQDKLETIFERFSQGEESTTRNFGGTGLGLNICKQLIELQHGELKVRSFPGVGSDFYFSLVYLKIDQITESKIPEINDVNPKKRKLSILLCEDNPLNQKLAINVIKNYGFELDIANNGQEGIGLLEKNTYDLILMDLQMPVKDGYQTTVYIRNIMKSSIPIIAMTAHSLIGERQKCFDIGMNAYVPKPFRQDELLNKIYAVIENDNAVEVSEQVDDTLFAMEVNLSYLKELSMGSTDFEKEIIEIFIPQVDSDMKILLEAMENKNFSVVKDVAHGLKSSFSLFMLTDAVEFLSQLESEALGILNHTSSELSSKSIQKTRQLNQNLKQTYTTLNELLLNEYACQ